MTDTNFGTALTPGDPIIVHICKDKTFTIRSIGEAVFNGVALPVISCRNRDEAEALQVATCALEQQTHPNLAPGAPWYRLASGEWGTFSPPTIELEELGPIADYLATVLERIRNQEGA